MLFLLLLFLFGETGEGQAFLWLFNTILLLCLISLCSCYGLCGFCFWAAILQRYLPKVDDCNLHLSLVQSCLFYWCACIFIRRSLERSCVVILLFWFRLSWSTVLDFLVLPSFCFVLSCRSPEHKARLGYLVLWYPCSPQDPSCSPWELWPLEASVGPKWFCGTGSSGSTLSAIDVAPCVFGFPMTAGSRVLFKPNGSDIWHPSCLSQTGQSLQDHVPTDIKATSVHPEILEPSPIQNHWEIWRKRSVSDIFWPFEGWGTWSPPRGPCLYRRSTSE